MRKFCRSAVRFLLISLSVTMIIATIATVLLTVYLKRYKNPDTDNILFDPEAAPVETKILTVSGKGGEYSCERLGGAGTCIPVSYSEIPVNLINAFISVEDKHFFSHKGIDVARSIKAAANSVFHFERQFGGSTITQQLVKNATGDDEISPERKLREMFRAVRLEEISDKTQILESYLNIINLSSGCRGIGAAAERYFGKKIGELTLAECASVAAITNNPSRYDPLRHPENNKSRRDLILSRMLEEGYIGEGEYKTAVNTPIDTSSGIEKVGENVNSWFTDMLIEDVVNDLCEKLDCNRRKASELVYYGGLSIYSTQNAEIQSIIDGYFSDEKNFPIGVNGRPQTAIIIVNPNNGDILAVCGGVGKKSGNRVINHASGSHHSPGSTIKPVGVYAPAIEKGLINWATVYDDSPVKTDTLSDGSMKQWPANSDGKYRGMTDIATAVARSTNTIAVKVVENLGIRNSMDFMRDRLGIKNLIADTDGANDLTPVSLALGQLAVGITVRELTGAYTALLDGVYKRPRAYYEVRDRNGNLLLSNKNNQETAMSRDTAAIVTKMLENVVTKGTARGLKAPVGVACAAKTGTTQNNCDRWLMAYTPDILVGMWMGYEYPKPLDGIKGNRCIGIFNRLVPKIYDACGFEKTQFDVPEGLVKLSYCKLTGRLSDYICHNSDCCSIGWFSSDNIPEGSTDGWFADESE